jgi:hypothetical protein
MGRPMVRSASQHPSTALASELDGDLPASFMIRSSFDDATGRKERLASVRGAVRVALFGRLILKRADGSQARGLTLDVS